MYLLSTKKYTHILKICGLLALLALLVACGDSNNTNVVTPTLQSGTAIANTPGAGPTVITVVTVVPTGGGGSTATPTPQGTQGKPQQVVTLADRVLAIDEVSEQAGSGASTMAVGLTISVSNTSPSPILNQAAFYQLVGAEGDSFGTQSSVSPGFYGSIPPRGSREGTIVFQVPTGALKGLRLLYRPEVGTETTLIPLNT